MVLLRVNGAGTIPQAVVQSSLGDEPHASHLGCHLSISHGTFS